MGQGWRFVRRVVRGRVVRSLSWRNVPNDDNHNDHNHDQHDHDDGRPELRRVLRRGSLLRHDVGRGVRRCGRNVARWRHVMRDWRAMPMTKG